MTTDLATVQQLHNTPDLLERDRGAAEAVAAGLRDAKAGNTAPGLGLRLAAVPDVGRGR